MATNYNEDSSATPVAKPPPLAAAADELSTNPSPTETTNLLPNGTDHSKANVHYRDCISGPHFQFLFWSLIFGCMIAVFDTTLMASAHPVITSYFNASNAASWFTTVFYLSMTISQPVFGRVSDTVGRRPVLLFAIIIFLISIIWCGVAGTVGSFIAARGVGGIGAGGILSLASVLTSDMVKIEYRGIYQSYFNLAYGTGNGLGAALGGVLCDKLGWRSAFYVQLPFVVVYGILAALSCPDDLGPNFARTQGQTIGEAFKSFDKYGSVSMIFMVSGLILGVNLGGNVLTWTHPLVIGSLAVAVIAGIGLIFIERKAEWPILRLKLFTTTPMANVMGSIFFACMLSNTILFNVPLYVQAVRQTSATTSGLYLVPSLVCSSVTAITTGFYITITRQLRQPLVVGSIFALVGAVAVACLSIDTPLHLVPWFIMLCSIGQGLFFPAATISILALNTQEDQAVATTTNGLVRSLGSILGVALSSWVLQNALLIYLNKYVTHSNAAVRREIIRTARESIQSIRHLEPMHKEQVVYAYSVSLRATFLAAVVFATISTLLILPARVPLLQRQEEKDKAEADPLLQAEESGAINTSETDDDDEERALFATPTQTLRRTMTSATSRSGTSRRNSTSFGERTERRASFDTNL